MFSLLFVATLGFRRPALHVNWPTEFTLSWFGTKITLDILCFGATVKHLVNFFCKVLYRWINQYILSEKLHSGTQREDVSSTWKGAYYIVVPENMWRETAAPWRTK